MQQPYSTEQERGYGSNEFYQQQAIPLQNTQSTLPANGPRSSQRLGLAITSLATLFLISVAITGLLTHEGRAPLDWAALVLACVMIVFLSSAVVVINFIFSYRY